MDRCNATCDLSPCTNCNGPECSERIEQPKTNREWLAGLSNKELAEVIFLHCPPGRHVVPSICGRIEVDLCKDCWVKWLSQPAEIKEGEK